MFHFGSYPKVNIASYTIQIQHRLPSAYVRCTASLTVPTIACYSPSAYIYSGLFDILCCDFGRNGLSSYLCSIHFVKRIF